MITFRDVRKSYGSLPVLRSVSLYVPAGSVTVVCGPSGAGKTTLLRCTNGLERIDGGELIVDGVRINGRRAAVRRLRTRVGMVFQQQSLYPHLTVVQNVALAPIHAKGLRRAVAEEMALALLAKVGIADKARAYPAELSGGQQQRVAIARALAMDPLVLLLDEPTSSLDPHNKGEVLDTIGALAADGRTMLIATHELNFARHVADAILLLDEGCIVESAPPEQFLFAAQHQCTHKFLARFKELML